MPAKTRSPRKRKEPSIHDRVKAHMAATAQCEKWARKGIELAKAGRITEAKAAEEKARLCLAKIMALEPKYGFRERS